MSVENAIFFISKKNSKVKYSFNIKKNNNGLHMFICTTYMVLWYKVNVHIKDGHNLWVAALQKRN